MGGVWYRFRAEIGSTWRGLIVLALLAGLAGAVSLAAIAGARRTDSAFSRMLAATNAADVLVNPDYGNDSNLDIDRVRALPMVAELGIERGISALPLPIRGINEIENTLALGLADRASTRVGRVNVLEGRQPKAGAADEVLVNPRFASRAHLSVGDRFDVLVLRRADFGALDAAGLTPAQTTTALNEGRFGRRIPLRLVGIGVAPSDIVVDEGFEQSAMITTPAFVARHRDANAGFYGLFLRLRHRDADLPAFKRAVQALPHEGAIEFQTTRVTAAKVDRAVRPDVGALSIFAIVIALTGLLVVAQASARQMFVDSIDHPTLRAVGYRRRELFATSMARASVVALVAASLAVVGAIALSPLTPIGPARNAEPDPGVRLDAPVLVVGGLAIVLAVLALAAIPAWWYSRAGRSVAERAPARASRVSEWLRGAGAPLPAASGVRMALEPGRGRTAVPVRTTIVGCALAIGTVVAAVTFAVSLDHLVSTPRLYGWSWDLRVTTSGDDAADAAAVTRTVDRTLHRAASVRAYSDTVISRIDVDGVTVTALGVHPRKGVVEPTIVSGRAPIRADEVALGARTLDQIGASVGDRVRVRPDAGGAPEQLRVVGRVVLPGLGTYPGSDKTALGEGALLTKTTLQRLGPDFGAGPFLVRLHPGANRSALTKTLIPSGRFDKVEVATLERPSDIVAYERVRSTPLLLAGILAVLAVATVANALIAAVRRRRRDLALLKTLGFTRRQVSASVAWQSTTLAAVALVIGLPLGVIVGRWAWTALADNLGTVAEPIVPLTALVVAVPVVVLAANAVAFVPGRIAARLRPATVLRSE